VTEVLLLLLLLLLLLSSLTANVFLPGGSVITIRHNTQNNTPRSNKKHRTQNYTNNREHTTHNEYNAITTTINNTIKKCMLKISLLQAMEAHRVTRG
jgi:ABC-type transport system involved in multi-copper enzyme maturation permease subunit